MIEFFVMRIINGKTSLENVPDKYKDDVARTLVERGYPELVTT